MTRKIITFILFALMGLSPAWAQTNEPADVQILKRDFTRMMEWFPGRYDNQEQVYFQKRLKVDEDLHHGRIHHIFAPVKLENFPGRTFYIQQYQNDDPTDIYRQRIYSFTADHNENAIRLKIYIPKDPKALVDAHLDASKLKGLSPDDFRTLPGCDVFWRYENDFYHGFMKKDACQVESRRSNRTLIITDDLQLSETSIWIRDEAVDSDGNYVYGNKAGIHHKNNRARPFSCWVSPQKEDGSYGFYPAQKTHDQGGRIWIEAQDGHPRVGLKIRNVDWPYGRNRPSLVLYAYKGDEEDKAVSYAWTDPEGKRIAINLRWMQASCTLDENGFFPKP